MVMGSFENLPRIGEQSGNLPWIAEKQRARRGVHSGGTSWFFSRHTTRIIVARFVGFRGAFRGAFVGVKPCYVRPFNTPATTTPTMPTSIVQPGITHQHSHLKNLFRREDIPEVTH